MADRRGQQLGNYRLIRLLGQGGFAEVYLGEHVHLQTQAAIKILRTQPDEDDLSAFLSEAQIIAHLGHPHIVKVLEFSLDGGVPYLVMDYAPNGTLRARHRRGVPLAPADILPYIKQVAAALQYAHDQRLIHRDIKPENMLLGRSNEVLLSDFGIATVVQTTSKQLTQGVAGTAAYVAPEQLKGKAVQASDQYSLAIVVYEWLTGDTPFQGMPLEIAFQHASEPPPSLREKVPGLSPAIEQAVLIALSKLPQQRFDSVSAFAFAFEQAVQTAPTLFPGLATPSGSSPSAPPVEQIGQGGSAIYSAPTQVTPLPPAPMPSTVFQRPRQHSDGEMYSAPTQITPPPVTAPLASEPSPGAEQPTLPPHVPAKPVISLSRRQVLIGGAVGLAAVGGVVGLATAQNWLHASASASSTPKASPTPPASPTSTPGPGTTLFVYRGSSSSVFKIAWSPNGIRIASAHYEGTVHVWDVTTGGNVFIYREHSSHVFSAAWSPDGRRIASAGEDKTVRVWDASDGGNVYIYRGHSDWVHPAVWSPNGQRIASGGGDLTVHVWDASDGGSPYIYRGHDYPIFSVAWSPNGQRIASASGDRTVQVWDADIGGNVYTYRGHFNDVHAVAWSPNGQRIASAGVDGTVQVWDASDGGSPYIYRGHPNGVETVAWSSDSKYIASGGVDGTVQLWLA